MLTEWKTNQILTNLGGVGMSEFVRKYGIEFSDNNYQINFLYRGDGKDVDRLFDKIFYSTFGRNKLIRGFEYNEKNNKVLNEIIDDIKDEYLRDGDKQMVEYLENGFFRMGIYIYSNVNDSVFEKQVLKFVNDVMDVIDGKKSINSVRGFAVDTMIKVVIDFYSNDDRSFTTLFKDFSKNEKVHISLSNIKVEKDRYSPYELVTLVLSIELL